VCRLPDLAWLRPGSFHGAYAALVLEHLEGMEELFEGVAEVVRPGGVLAVVCNHPAFTTPGSGPVVDPEDGEVLWRWGRYLERGRSRQPAGQGSVVFHHRPLGDLLSAAAGAGWCLERAVERGVGRARATQDPLLSVQQHIPRLLGLRWRNR
jgi:hypothetical protein